MYFITLTHKTIISFIIIINFIISKIAALFHLRNNYNYIKFNCSEKIFYSIQFSKQRALTIYSC